MEGEGVGGGREEKAYLAGTGSLGVQGKGEKHTLLREECGLRKGRK